MLKLSLAFQATLDKFQVLEDGAGHYWLDPRPWGYNPSPFPIPACREA